MNTLNDAIYPLGFLIMPNYHLIITTKRVVIILLYSILPNLQNTDFPYRTNACFFIYIKHHIHLNKV